MTRTRAATSMVFVTAVVSVLWLSALGMVRGQTIATLLERSNDLQTAAASHADWNGGLHDIRALYVMARREVVEHVEYVVDRIVRKR